MFLSHQSDTWNQGTEFPNRGLLNTELQAGAGSQAKTRCRVSVSCQVSVRGTSRTHTTSPYLGRALVPGSPLVGPLQTGDCSFFLHWLYQLLKQEPGNLDSQNEW